jgi:presenilin-like A22 family membrane protease
MSPAKPRFKPVYWSILIFIIAQVLTFTVVGRTEPFLEESNIYIPPQPTQPVIIWPTPTTAPSGEVTTPPAASSLGPILLYFAAMIVVLGIVLAVIPLSALKFVFRALFALMFAWGIFILLIFWLPLWATLLIAAAVSLLWLFMPRIWLHNLVMVIAMVSVAAVFGRLISPWTAMILILALAVYDFFAVRFGYMLWLVKKMSQSSTLPAFILPRHASEWRGSVKQSDFSKMVEEKQEDRDYSILGGGDIAFPLLLTASVYFASGFNPALIVTLASMAGLIAAYWIQAVFLKGKPMPALPPIAALALIAFLIVG